eukprot:scaffold176917_cov33-Tisochrysis_lutea.AAC.3
MGLCADDLEEEMREQREKGSADAELKLKQLDDELERVKRAVCIWDLAMIMLIRRPLVAGACPFAATAHRHASRWGELRSMLKAGQTAQPTQERPSRKPLMHFLSCRKVHMPALER